MDPLIPFTSDAEVAAIGTGVLDRSLEKRYWTHRAHFAFALWVLRARPDLDAFVSIPPAIRAYNEATGVANTDAGGYHATITLASIRAARAFASGRAEPLFATCNALIESRLGRSDWPFAHWSRDVLFSVHARRAWVEPDIAPLPFSA